MTMMIQEIPFLAKMGLSSSMESWKNLMTTLQMCWIFWVRDVTVVVRDEEIVADGDVTSTDGQQQITPESSMFQGLNVISAVPPSPLPTAVGSADVTGGSQVSDMFSGLALSETSTPAKGSNVHLAALLAPSPASDPFPEAATPLKAEATTPLKAGATVPPQNQPALYPSAPTAMMPPYGAPQMAYMGQMPMMQQYPQPGITHSRNTSLSNDARWNAIHEQSNATASNESDELWSSSCSSTLRKFYANNASAANVPSTRSHPESIRSLMR